MVLGRNAPVNKAATAAMVHLARGESFGEAAKIDPNIGVMPSLSAGDSQVEHFADSVRPHLDAAKELKNLRGTTTAPHPVFGASDAHQWNCLFTFQLGPHFRQAKHVTAGASCAP